MTILPPIKRKPAALSPGIKQPDFQSKLSPPSNAKVKNAWSYNLPPHPLYLYGAMFNKTRGQFFVCLNNLFLPEDYRFIVERRFACPNDPESYTGGS
jgi:hypothetical protein